MQVTSNINNYDIDYDVVWWVTGVLYSREYLVLF